MKVFRKHVEERIKVCDKNHYTNDPESKKAYKKAHYEDNPEPPRSPIVYISCEINFFILRQR